MPNFTIGFLIKQLEKLERIGAFDVDSTHRQLLPAFRLAIQNQSVVALHSQGDTWVKLLADCRRVIYQQIPNLVTEFTSVVPYSKFGTPVHELFTSDNLTPKRRVTDA